MPASYGPWKTVYNNFLRWRDQGVWEKVLQNLNREPEPPWQTMLDSTSVKARQHSAGAKKGRITIRLLAGPGED